MELVLFFLAGCSLIIKDATAQPGLESSNQAFEYMLLSYHSELKVKICHYIQRRVSHDFFKQVQEL